MYDFKFKMATNNDSKTIKDLINKMYGYEYEIRDNLLISQSIDKKNEIYILAYLNNDCIGISGASLNNDYYKDIIAPDIAVIDYIFTDESYRNIRLSYELLSRLLKALVDLNVKSAIMQVQTFNKQRFFHYALSDKNIINDKTINRADGTTYDDQILLIKDLSKVVNMSAKELMLKAHSYYQEEKKNNA